MCARAHERQADLTPVFGPSKLRQTIGLAGLTWPCRRRTESRARSPYRSGAVVSPESRSRHQRHQHHTRIHRWRRMIKPNKFTYLIGPQLTIKIISNQAQHRRAENRVVGKGRDNVIASWGPDITMGDPQHECRLPACHRTGRGSF